MPTWTMHREVYTAGEETALFDGICAHRTLTLAQLVASWRGRVCRKISCFFMSTLREAARSPRWTRYARAATVCTTVSTTLRASRLMSHLGCVLVTQEILTYRHIASSASFALSKELLMQARAPRHPLPPLHSDRGLQVRADAFQRIIIPQRGWEKFSIWGCGRDGKRFFHLLSRENKQRVRALRCHAFAFAEWCA
jgi:hypothetical protein